MTSFNLLQRTVTYNLIHNANTISISLVWGIPVVHFSTAPVRTKLPLLFMGSQHANFSLRVLHKVSNERGGVANADIPATSTLSEKHAKVEFGTPKPS